ncbi:hypothetical protein PBY51_005794 [Eleginops maclovinus]|uniref:Uncharacterized protein n=1 Tax=Eleginops maclovinus TaxID=56733 RepID=A0AAN7WTG4_ELEMC|nr:hypothetical protein PBY51_005794 [Eleginops maclovinus]
MFHCDRGGEAGERDGVKLSCISLTALVQSGLQRALLLLSSGFNSTEEVGQTRRFLLNLKSSNVFVNMAFAA